MLSVCSLIGCANSEVNEENKPGTGVAAEQEDAVIAEEPEPEAVMEPEEEIEPEEETEPETIYRINIDQNVFEDVIVLSDSLYAYKKSGDMNWTVARCADDVILDIAAGEELVANLQDNSFAVNAVSPPNNYLYDAEGNLLWEAAGKEYMGCLLPTGI